MLFVSKIGIILLAMMLVSYSSTITQSGGMPILSTVSQSTVHPVYNGFIVKPQRRGRVGLSHSVNGTKNSVRILIKYLDGRRLIHLIVSEPLKTTGCYQVHEYAVNRSNPSWGLQSHILGEGCLKNSRLNRYLSLAKERNRLKNERSSDQRRVKNSTPEISRLRQELASNKTYRNRRCSTDHLLSSGSIRKPKKCPQDKVKLIKTVCTVQAFGPKACVEKMANSDSTIGRAGANALCTAVLNNGLTATSGTSIAYGAFGDVMGPVFGLPFKAISEYLVFSDYAICNDRARYYCDLEYIKLLQKRSSEESNSKRMLRACSNDLRKLAKLKSRITGPEKRISKLKQLNNEISLLEKEDSYLIDSNH